MDKVVYFLNMQKVVNLRKYVDKMKRLVAKVDNR